MFLVIRTAFTAFRANLGFFLFITGLFAALDVLSAVMDRRLGYFGVKIFLAMAVAMYAHRMVLLKERVAVADTMLGFRHKSEKPPLGLFILVASLFFAIGVGAMVVSYSVVSGHIPKSMHNNPGALVLLTSIPALFFQALVLAAVGTILPAAATGQTVGIALAWQRGRQQFMRTLWRLISVNVLCILIYAVILVGLVYLVRTLPARFEPVFEWSRLGINAVKDCILILLTATTLSLAYETSTAADQMRRAGSNRS